jgi:hypothetical protein
LRDLGPLEKLNVAMNAERQRGSRKIPPLPSDAFRVWALNYRAFKQDVMAQRIEVLEAALYGLIQKGIVGPSVRVLDHGICGGLLLLKCSTYWFRLIFASRNTKLPKGSANAELQKRLVQQFATGPAYHAIHWWTQVVWATAAVAIHNIQQIKYRPEWPAKTKLAITDDPLAYLGILVDVLQEWDRHSARRVSMIERGLRRINSSDVSIGVDPGGVIRIRYGCRDGTARSRQRKMIKDLDSALADWRKLAAISFYSI